MFTSSVTSIRKYTMSLLDKIDILITPNAYKKGKLFAALPSPTFGGELAVDGDFADGSTAWTLNPGWSIGGNSARYDGNALGTSIAQNISGVTGGNRYTVTFEVTQNTGDQNNTISLGSTTLTNSTHLPLGCNTFTGVAGFGTALNIYGNSGELLIIRNLTVKQELTGIADLDFTRASAATRVDPLGFINYAGVLPGVEQVTNGNFQQIGPEEVSNGDFDEIGPEEVSNGDFNQTGPEEVSNGDFSEIGTELVTDGGFPTGTTAWTLQANASIGNNELTLNGSSNTVYALQNLYSSGLYNGKTLQFTYEIISNTLVGGGDFRGGGITGGSLFPSANLALNSTVGTHTVDIVINSTGINSALDIFITAPYTSGSLVIDNVSVKEVGQDWTVTGSDSTHYVEFLSTGARFVSDTTSPVLELKQNAITSGKQYKLTCNIAYTGVGQLRVNVGTNLTPFTEGANTKYFTATSSTMSFLRENANVDCLISNVSVKEVGQDWSYNGATIGDDKANIIGDGSAFTNISQSGVFTSGKQYKVTVDVTINSGLGLKFQDGANNENIGFATTSGSYTFYFSSTSNTTLVIGRRTGGTAFNSSVDNVSVKEVGQDWTFGNGWGMGDDKANYDATVTGTELRQLMSSIAAGKTVKIEFDILDVEAAKDAFFKLECSGAPESVFTYTKFSAGTYTYYHTITSGFNRLTFTALNNSTGGYFSIDNVSVKEVFQGWTIGTGSAAPELSLGSVTFTSNSQNLFQPWTEETGTTYYIQLEGEGPVRIRTGFTGIPAQKIAVTLPDIITVNTDVNTNRIQIYGSNTGTAVLTNVSIVEGGEIDIPRIDYTGGGCPHILVEPQRSNRITYSEDFTDSSWVKTNVDVSNNTELAPNGTETATRAIISSTGTDLRTQCNVIESTNYTFTFYAKKGTSTDITYRVYDVSNGSNIVSPTNYFSQVGIDWQRVELNFTTPSGCTSVLVYLSSDSAVVGDIYLWGAQLEEGSYATSYIPTEGTTATRATETYESAEDISGLIGQTEGTFFIELSKPVLSPDNYITISLNNAASNSIDNTLTIGFKNSNEYYIRLRAGGTSVFTSGNTASLANTFYKIAVSYKSGQSLIYIDGSPITPNGGNLSNAFAFTATLDNLSFDLDGDNTSPFYGNVKQLQVYDTALTDEELTLLTIPPNSTYSTYAEMANALNYTLQ